MTIRREEGQEGRIAIAVTQEGAGARPALVAASAFPQDAQTEVAFDGLDDTYLRRVVTLPLR